MAAKSTVVFHSRFTEHELVRRPRIQIPLPTGGWQTSQNRVAYQFHKAPAPDLKGGLIGVCTVTVGRDRMVDSDGWLAPGQEQGVERDAVDALRAHNAFGMDFWEAGHGPGTKYPRPEDFRRDVMAAGVALDSEKLRDLIAAERSSHVRPDLIEFAEATLETVDAEIEKAAAAAPPPEWQESDSNTALAAVCDRRGLTVVPTGQNGPVKADYVKALQESEAVPA